MTTAWIDIRDCKDDEIPDIIAAAAEHRIEGVIFDGEAGGTLAARQAGVQWVAFKNGGGPDKIEADICVHCHNGGASGLAASHLRHSKKDGILVDVENMESLEEACAAVRAGLAVCARCRPGAPFWWRSTNGWGRARPRRPAACRPARRNRPEPAGRFREARCNGRSDGN